jgi:hypothetical protein
MHILKALVDVTGGRPSTWPFFKCFAIILCSPHGSGLLQAWTMTDVRRLGDSCKTPSLVADVLDCFTVSYLPEAAALYIGSFLNSRHEEVFRLSLQGFLGLASVVTNFAQSLYALVIAKFIHNDLAGLDDGRRAPFVDFLAELLLKHKQSLILTAQDPDIHPIIREHARPVYPLLFSHLERFTPECIADEISWWMTTGNTAYVGTYQVAVNAVINGGRKPVLVHLFGQLAKSAAGREAAAPHIQGLLAELSSANGQVQRGAVFAIAHFASEKATHSSLKDAFKRLIACWQIGSYELKGTIIAAAALIPRSKYWARVLADNNWQVFAFGDRRAAFPCDLEGVKKETGYQPPVEELESEGEGTGTGHALVKRLGSSITIQKAKDALEKLEKDERVVLASFAFDYISRFFVSPDGRETVMRILSLEPVILPVENQVDDLERRADIGARIWLIVKKISDDRLSQIEIPKVTISAISKETVCKRCPEVFVDDDEFGKWAGMTKREFYALGMVTVTDARKRLMHHKDFQ